MNGKQEDAKGPGKNEETKEPKPASEGRTAAPGDLFAEGGLLFFCSPFERRIEQTKDHGELVAGGLYDEIVVNQMEGLTLGDVAEFGMGDTDLLGYKYLSAAAFKFEKLDRTRLPTIGVFNAADPNLKFNPVLEGDLSAIKQRGFLYPPVQPELLEPPQPGPEDGEKTDGRKGDLFD